MSFLRALDEETGSMFKTRRFIIYCLGGKKKHILSFCFSVCQKQNIIYSWGMFLVLMRDMAQQNVPLFSNKSPKLVLMVRSHLTTRWY